MEKVEDAAARLGTSCHDRPDAFEPTLTGGAARALRHLAINHHKTNRLLGQVVGWLDAGGRDETQITFAMLLETFDQIVGLFRVGHAPDDLRPKLVAGALQSDLEAAR